MQHFDVVTRSRSQFVDITEQVLQAVTASGCASGRVTVFVPHTTCGLALNEKADPDVAADILRQLAEAIPWRQPFYRHAEGNSAAHLKASLAGASLELFVAGGQIQLGVRQAVFLCEFDGPRTRRGWVK
jgi:secondary thiamine-phosphate synthase enzyme